MLAILLSVIFVSFLFVDGQLPAPDGNLNFYTLPVGQGDCTVIQCPKQYGWKISIIDAGSSRDTGFDGDDLVNFIAGQGVENILLTHPDEDHISYVDKIFDSIRKAGRPFPDVYHSCPWSSYKSFVTDADAEKNAIRINKCCGKADCSTEIRVCGTGPVFINIIGSEQESCSGGGGNGDSVVSYIQWGGGSVGRRMALLAGDFEGPKDFIDDFLKCATDVTAQIYRVAHHGAYNGLANTHTFLNAIGAKYVISSSGLHVENKHPHCELHDYYTNPNHPADTVPQHNYDCFDEDGDLLTKRPNKAIYTTTMMTPSNQYTNYIIHLACNFTADTIIPYEIRFN